MHIQVTSKQLSDLTGIGEYTIRLRLRERRITRLYILFKTELQIPELEGRIVLLEPISWYIEFPELLKLLSDEEKVMAKLSAPSYNFILEVTDV